MTAILRIIKRNEKFVINAAASVIKAGGIIIYPTETAYGIGADATNEDSIKKIFKIKGRKAERAIPIIVSDLKMAKKYATIDEKGRKLINAFMPGPLTIVVKKKNKMLPDILSKDTVALRISGSEFARALVKKSGVPLTSTSANISGMPLIYDSNEVRKIFFDKVDLILDSGKLKRKKPSTVFDLTSNKLLRKGPISLRRILSKLKC